MATHKIGKLKFNLSKAGLAFRWGDGEIRRFSFPFGRNPDEDSDAAGGFDDDAYGDASGDGYDRYEDDYADDGGYDDGGYDDGYADDGGYAGDGDYADEDDYGYEDDYADGYDDGYYDDDGAYIEGAEPQSAIMRYIDENDWVTYALLVLLPPMGIYLLWRRGQFDTVMRAGISAASGIWLIAMLWIIIALFSGGASDDTSQQQILLISQTPTVAATVTPSPSPSTTPAGTGLGGIDLDGTPIPTPITGDVPDAGTTGTQYVYSPPTGIYYHAIDDCTNIPAGTSLSRMLVESAQNRGQSPCPVCFNTATFYATQNGKYYHSDQYCSGMTNASSIGEQAAINAGKQKCPVCILKTDRTIEAYEQRVGANRGDTGSGNVNTSALTNYMKRLSNDQSGVKVWATRNGKHFHTDRDCSGMKGASNISLLAALQNGKTACPTCASAAGRTVYATDTGTYYHRASTCSSGLRNGQPLTLAHALVMGKESCPTCIGNVSVPQSGGGGATPAPGSGGATPPPGSSGTYTPGTSGIKVYATQGGRYYHLSKENAGSGASHITLETALNYGMAAAPEIASFAERTVYAAQGDTYFYATREQAGSGARGGTMASALAFGLKPWSGEAEEEAPTSSGIYTPGTSGIKVYATQDGRYYHFSKSAAGSDASYITLETALNYGKVAAPEIASTAERIVYAAPGDEYFYPTREQAGSGARSGTAATALAYGLKPWPDAEEEAPESSNAYTPGTSGIKVYATLGGKYYYLSKSSAGSGATHITLETALNYGKVAAPEIASVAERTVYSAPGDRYFHATRSHAGSGAKSGKAAAALAYGLKPCPDCFSGSGSPSPGTTPGPGATSAPSTVYIDLDGDSDSYLFHRTARCSGSGMLSGEPVTLEFALAQEFRPCPHCW